ncbi:MAG: 50S ribosomal protein L11 methyltransferase [Verrucomicrobia bacterium]|nr:50S ribosomal protein L11 methyltransferase [Cytophagales bacterium]
MESTSLFAPLKLLQELMSTDGVAYLALYLKDSDSRSGLLKKIGREFESKNLPYEIIINPKMSFGTGHHHTTALMIANQLIVNHVAKKVLDIGCGTGILAIMAAKLGASSIDAIDTEVWAVENALENAQLNGCENIDIQQGTVKSTNLLREYQLILANINRNVLLEEIPYYTKLLADKGFLIVSGFYEQDIAEITNVANTVLLENKVQRIENQWVSIIFEKK